MKQAENNGIDSLLRVLARRERAAAIAQNVSAPAGRNVSAETSMHLDGDELSAYAENALPDATRTRYMAHLADCDDCRRIVTQLAVAVSLPAPERVERETVTLTWRGKLAALFSPPVMRYAMPALVLVAVIAVGFFALRQQREKEMVALNQSAENSRVASAQVESKQSGTSSRSEAKVSPATDEQGQAQSKASESKAAASTAANASPTAAPAKDAANDKEAAGEETAASQPAAAPEPPPAPKPTADEKAKAEKPAAAADENREQEDVNARRKEADKQSAVARNAPAPPRADPARVQGGRVMADSAEARASGAGVGGAKKANNEAETRTVSGRRFRRQSGAWVDTAYDSSQSTTSVARGSEQYRALVADEPGIGAIAEQLSGEVVVVWKGHAYRIH